jgi:hypothetical protein
MGTFFRDSTINWECAEQRQEYQNYCRYRRQRARREKGNAGW